MKIPTEKQYGSINMLQVPGTTRPRDSRSKSGSSLFSTTEFSEFGTTLSVVEGQEIRPKSGVERSKWKQLANRLVLIREKITPVTKSEKTRRIVEISIYTILGIYILIASVMNFTKALPLLILYLVMLLFLVWKFAYPVIKSCSQSNGTAISLKDHLSTRFCRNTVFTLYILVGVFIIFTIIYWNFSKPRRLISAAGLLLLILASILISKRPTKIKLRPVLWGLTLQYAFAVFVLRTETGFNIFQFLGDSAQSFLSFSYEGIDFVFKPYDSQLQYNLITSALMVVPFFSAVISALYYFGVMQFIVGKFAFLMQKTMKTTATESMSAAANIFVGQTEAPLLVKPYLETMTNSELHAIMTGGFATIAGGVFAAYVSMGVSPSHLISASVMSAPAALAFSKIVYPAGADVQKDDDDSTPSEEREPVLNDSSYENVLHAVSVGAKDGMFMAINIIANLVAFISIVAALNSFVHYAGDLINFDTNLYSLLQYIFYPLAFMLGADIEDCLKIGELIGLKTIVNEFVAYNRMSEMMAHAELSKRSELIATYALCGFSNLGSIGVQLGGMGALVPKRQKDLAQLGLRAFMTGNIACFSTACIAALLYKDSG